METLILGWGYAVFVVAFGMMNYRSIPLWKVLPELPYFQFPWRFLILTTFISPVFLITLDKFKYSKQLSLGLIFVIVAINAFQFRPHDFLGRTDAYYLNRYVPYPQASEDYKLTQEEYLRLSKNTTVRPNQVYQPFFADGPLTIQPIKNSPLDFEAKIGVIPSTDVSFNKYVFPGWQTVIDGNLTDSTPGKPYGQINFQLLPGFHVVRVFFTETADKKILDLISILSGVLAIAMVIPKRWFRFKLG